MPSFIISVELPSMEIAILGKQKFLEWGSEEGALSSFSHLLHSDAFLICLCPTNWHQQKAAI